MSSKDHFRNLAQMSRRIAGNMIDPVIVARLQAIGEDYDLQADLAPDTDPPKGLVPQRQHLQGRNERT